MYPDGQGERRRGFRHELASTLALFDVLRRHRPVHPALLGPWGTLFGAAGLPAQSQAVAQNSPNVLEQEVLALSGDEFDLLAYLICSHHGKVRFSWHAAPADQEAADPVLRIRGVRDGDVLPPLLLLTTAREAVMLPASVMSLAPAASGISRLTGLSWAARALRLLQMHGPYKLAYLEALLRVADQRVSKRNLPDSILGPRSIAQEAAA
jgi:CRISPR-associated endonuclease/helicase Cas3